VISNIKQGRIFLPPKPSLHGVLALNKERGPSSNGVLQKVRRLLGGIKAGHAGTLDPGAEGVLLVLLGEATKLMPFTGALVKEYVGKMEFGSGTDTHDGEGEVVATAPAGHLTREFVAERMSTFLGETKQVPPMYSAVKVNGERLYRLARRGEKVSRPARNILLHEFSLLLWENPVLEFRVRCGGGTYMRKLCHDLAKKCGTEGHMTSLTRTAVGPFRLEEAITIADLEAMVRQGGIVPLAPLTAPLTHLPAMTLTAAEAADTRQGKRLFPSAALAGQGTESGKDVKLVDGEGHLVGVVRYEGPDREMPIRRVFTVA
jgi:tRNA pseudouridine55 synthase